MVIIVKCNLIYKQSLQYAFDRCFTYQYFDFVLIYVNLQLILPHSQCSSQSMIFWIEKKGFITEITW